MWGTDHTFLDEKFSFDYVWFTFYNMITALGYTLIITILFQNESRVRNIYYFFEYTFMTVGFMKKIKGWSFVQEHLFFAIFAVITSLMTCFILVWSTFTMLEVVT
jgi:hypothetical protein